MNTQRLLVIVVMVFAPQATLFGQDAKFGMILEFGRASIKQEKAEVARVEQQAWLLRVGPGVRLVDWVDLSTGLGVLFLGDHDKFEQSTTGGQKSSTTGGLNVFIQAGIVPSLMFRSDDEEDGFPRGIALGVNGGYNYFNASRHIPNCIDCDEEDLQIHGGLYWQPTVLVFISREAALGASFTRYGSSSDMKSDWLVTLKGSFE